jgi:N-acetylneuraminate lyase
MKLQPGIYAAQLVPYTQDGEVKGREFAAMIDRNIVLGELDGLYIGGSAGENFLSDAAAKRKVLETAAEAAAGRVSLIAQIGSLDLREAEGLAKLAASLKFDAVSAVTPYYYKFSFAETREYYIRLAEAARIPMLVYSIPSLEGTSFDIDQSRTLYEHPLVAGLKYSSGDLFTMERLLEAFPDRMIFSSYDELLLPSRALGAYGAIGSTYNVFARLARRIWDSVDAGRLSDAREAQAAMNGAIQELAALGLYQSLKEIVSMDGIDVGDCLPPFSPLSDEARDKARSIGKRLAERGLIRLACVGR